MPVELTCEHCGEVFEVAYPCHAKGRRFCSHACSEAAQRGAGHYNWQGGEVPVACEECGREVLRRKDQLAKYGHHFCSVECRGKFIGRQTRGEANPRFNPNKFVAVTCTACGIEFQREQWRANRGATNQFCSGRCRMDFSKRDRHPRWAGGRVEVKCRECGAAVLRDPHRARGGRNQFCGRECQARFYSRTTRGENSPHWKGGGWLTRDYGPNWRHQCRLARKRDGHKCVLCGATAADLGKQPCVHHITPFRLCPSWREANRLDNLICLCPSCHKRHETDADFANIARARITEAERATAGQGPRPRQLGMDLE